MKHCCSNYMSVGEHWQLKPAVLLSNCLFHVLLILVSPLSLYLLVQVKCDNCNISIDKNGANRKIQICQSIKMV